MKKILFIFLATLMTSCCGDRIIEYDEMRFVATTNGDLTFSDTLNAGDDFTIIYSFNTFEDCDCSACFSEIVRNEILDDRTKFYLNTPFIINQDTIHSNTDLLKNINTINLLNLTDRVLNSQQLIDIDPALINHLPEENLEFTIESLTDDGIRITASKSFFVRH